MDFIDTMLEVPGLNVVKAAFVGQLYGLPVGCLDTHNAELYQTSPQAFYVTQQLSARLRLHKIQTYVDFTQGVGSSEMWWANWCELVALRYPQHYDVGLDVSGQHVECLR